MHPTRTYVLYSLLMGLANSSIVGAYIPLLLKVGLTLTDIAIVSAVCVAASIAFEIPTGLVADGKSRRFSVSCGVALFAAGTALYSFVNGFWIAFAAEMLAGIGMAFVSGALTAWLTDALRHRGEGDSLRHALATGSATSAAAMLVGGFVTALLVAPSHPRLCWIGSAVLAVCAFIVTRFAMDDSGEPIHRVSEARAWKDSVSMLRRTHALKWVTAAAMCFGLIAPFNIYWAPLVQGVGGPLAIAWSWVPIYGATALAAYAIRRNRVRAGHESGLVIISLLVTGAGLIAVLGQNGLASLIAFVVVHEAGRGLFSPLLEAYTQHHVEEHYRATYGSLQSFLGKIGWLVALGAVSWGAAGRPATPAVISAIFAIFGAGLIVSAGLLWIFRPKTAAS